MKRRAVFGVVLFLGLLLFVAAGLSLAQEGDEAALPEATSLANVLAAIPVQGRLTDAGGNPLNGSYSITYRVYDGSGGPLLCSDTDTVLVNNGLFTGYVDNCTSSHIDGKQLYVSFQVAGDPEMGKVPLYPVPYAWTLRPGAIISNTSTTKTLEVYSRGGGQAGTALWAENVGSSGIAVWGVANGSDAAIIASNRGSGILFKAFGGDGGEDEFRVNNDGSIESKADSYVFISGLSFLKDSEADTTRFVRRDNGSIQFYSGSASGGNRVVDLPVTLPGVLYGQPVKIKSVTVYYICQNSTNGYIDAAYVFKQSDAASTVTVITDSTDRTSTTATSFTLTPTSNNVLSSTQGIINIALSLRFTDDTYYVRIGGVRLQLGHHDLY